MVEQQEKYLIEKSSENLTIVTKAGTSEIRGSIIYIYGLASTVKRNLEKIQKEEFIFPDGFRVLIPEAPFRFNTKIGSDCNSWYDVNEKYDSYDEERYNEPQMLESLQSVTELVRKEATEIHNGDYPKVFLVGMS